MPGIANEAMEAYALDHTTPHPGYLAAITDRTHAELENPGMLTGPVEGRLLQTLVFAMGATRVLEIGTFSGYSAISMAAGLGAAGRIITCEVDRHHAEVAAANIAGAGFSEIIEIRVGDALSTIASLDGPFDFVFIDADKENYPSYYEAVLGKLAPRGLIVADNTLWSGRVVDGNDTEASTLAIRRFNDLVVADERVVCVQLTVRDGVTLIRLA